MSDAVLLSGSRIEQVKVFKLGAQVTRLVELETGELSLPARVRLTGLPLQLHDPSVRVSLASDDPQAQLPQASDLRLGLEVPPPDASLPPARDEAIRAAELELARRQALLARVERSIAQVQSVGSPPRPEPAEGEPPIPSPTEARLELLGFRRQQLEQLHQELDEARDAARLAREALSRLRARREAHPVRRQLRPHQLRKEAWITLRGPAAKVAMPSRVQLRISYLVPSARWTPSYALHLHSQGGQARLGLRAQVCQHTGEDWTGVTLTLSTAEALQFSDLPKLASLRIGRAQPAPARTGWRPPPTGAEALFSDLDQVQAAPPAAEPAPALGSAAASEDREFMALEQAEPEAEEQAPPSPRRVRRREKRAELRAQPMPAPQAASAPPPEIQALGVAKSTGGLLSSFSRTARDAFQDDALDDIMAASDSPGAHGGGPPRRGIDAARDLLDFDALRMAGPGEARRGKLRPASRQARYLELLASLDVQVTIAWQELTRWVGAQRRAVSGAALPPGHAAPARSGAFDHAWRGEQAVDVPGDGRFHAVPVLERRLPAELVYVAVPREAPEVFRSTRLDNPLKAPLLQGPVDVWLDGDYLLGSELHTVVAGGSVELGLGVEEGLRVARNTRYAEHSRGMIGRHLELEHSIHIELRNLLQRTVEVELRERLPVSREDDDEVQVELRQVAPPWEPWEQEQAPLRGAYRWKVSVAPGESRELTATYAVKISAKHELAGGNRREA